MVHRIHIIDSHTGGEPTRLVVSGGPDLGSGSMAERLEIFRTKYDRYRSAVVNEPRGSDVIVGALLCDPVDPSCAAGVIFFNNVGYLGMCGHGTIGLMVTLASMGKIGAGSHRIETPVGVVEARIDESGVVTLRNVPSYRYKKDIPVNVPGIGTVKGDIAWGGNWFFLVYEHDQRIVFSNVEVLTEYAWKIRKALEAGSITGEHRSEIDHIELYGSATVSGADSKNFVLCPGKSYDRSPCGTGTSAKLACLYADGKLREGEVWKQESIVGSIFEGHVNIVNGRIIPTIRGTAHVDAEADLILDNRDPFCWGIRS